MNLTDLLPEGVRSQTKKGQTYWSLRVKDDEGKRTDVSLKGIKGELTDDLLAQIQAAVLGIQNSQGAQPVGPKLIERKNVANPGTWGLAWRLRQQSDEWIALSEKSKQNIRSLVEDWLDSAIVEGSDITWKEHPCARTTLKLLEDMLTATGRRDRRKTNKAPVRGSQAGKLRREIKRIAYHARLEGWMTLGTDATADLRERPYQRQNWKSWTPQEVAAFEARHPHGTTARIVFEAARWSGQRVGDVADFRLSKILTTTRTEFDDHGNARIVSERVMLVKQIKGGARRSDGGKLAPVVVTPMFEEAVLAYYRPDPANPENDYLIKTEAGTRYQSTSFTRSMQNWREQAGLSRFGGGSMHGLRKLSAQTDVLAGATTKEIMAKHGWSSMKHAELYTKDADDLRLASNGAAKTVRLVRGNAA